MQWFRVLVLGKTGVGKSSLINYLFGESVMETGVGSPVTTKGFHSTEFRLNEFPVSIVDSWGLEVDKYDEYNEYLRTELNNRDVQNPASEWFHAVLYCVNGGGGRIEQFELDLIQEIVDASYPVTIVFTKSDQMTEHEFGEMKNLVVDRFGSAVPIVPVCSEGKTLMGGNEIRPFGKREISATMSWQFIESIRRRLPKRCSFLIHDAVEKWALVQRKFIETGAGTFNRQLMFDTLGLNAEEFSKQLATEIPQMVIDEVQATVQMYEEFLTMIHYPVPVDAPSFLQFSTELQSSAYDWVMESLPLVLASVVLPFGVFFVKDINRSDLYKQLNSYTQTLHNKLTTLDSQIDDLIQSTLRVKSGSLSAPTHHD